MRRPIQAPPGPASWQRPDKSFGHGQPVRLLRACGRNLPRQLSDLLNGSDHPSPIGRTVRPQRPAAPVPNGWASRETRAGHPDMPTTHSQSSTGRSHHEIPHASGSGHARSDPRYGDGRRRPVVQLAMPAEMRRQARPLRPPVHSEPAERRLHQLPRIVVQHLQELLLSPSRAAVPPARRDGGRVTARRRGPGHGHATSGEAPTSHIREEIVGRRWTPDAEARSVPQAMVVEPEPTPKRRRKKAAEPQCLRQLTTFAVRAGR